MQKDDPENSWYWFDFLHYRRTGQFCERLWDIATSAGDDDLCRYVLDYASHIGTVVVGHPFVNSIVGGPYRMHWKRHKLVENWIDAYAHKQFPDNTVTKSCLNLSGDDTYVADAIKGSYYACLCTFPDDKLPSKLGDTILQAMKDVYSDIDHPVTFSFDDLSAIAQGTRKKPTKVITAAMQEMEKRIFMIAPKSELAAGEWTMVFFPMSMSVWGMLWTSPNSKRSRVDIGSQPLA